MVEDSFRGGRPALHSHSQEPDRASAENGDIGGGSHLGDSGYRVDRHCEGFHLRGVKC